MSPNIACFIAATLLLLLPFIDALRIRRSGLGDSYALSEAFNKLAGSARKYPEGYEELLARQYFDDNNDDAYFNPNEDADLSMPLSIANGGYGFYPADLALKQFEPELSEREEYPYTYSGYDDRPFGPQKRTAYNPHRVVPTTEELRTLFGDVPVKRVVTRREPAAEQAKASRIEQNAGKLAEKMRKLIEAAEQLTKDETEVVKTVSEETPEGGKATKIVQETVKPDGVKETKIEEIFSENSPTETEDGKQSTVVKTEETSTTEEEGDNGSDIGPEADVLEQAQSKSKRASSSGMDNAVNVQQLLAELARLKDKVSKLELLRILEDEENDDLADALKYSTLDQLNEKEGYVASEYKDIAKATETEKLIQLLSDDLASMDRPDIRERLADYLEDEVVQSETDSNGWMDSPAVYEGVTGVSDLPEDEEKRSQADVDSLFPTADEVMKAEVEAAQKEEVEQQEEEEAEQEAEEEAEEEAEAEAEEAAVEQQVMEEVAEEAAEEVEKEIEEQKEEGQKLGVLKQILEGLPTDQLQELATELQLEESEALTEETCPAVFELSQNCAFADVNGIPLDEEARSLCNRHQLCYTCGSSLDLTIDNCDDGYQSTVLAKCDGDKSCVRNAVVFLAMMQMNHVYRPYSPSQCARPCVEEYITLGPESL